MQYPANRLHTLAHAAINDLENAFQECHSFPVDGLILSAMVKLKKIQDSLSGIDHTCSDNNPDRYCHAA